MTKLLRLVLVFILSINISAIAQSDVSIASIRENDSNGEPKLISSHLLIS